MSMFTANVVDVCLPCYFQGSPELTLAVPVHDTMRMGAFIRAALQELQQISEHRYLQRPADWKAARAALKTMLPWKDRRKRCPFVQGIERGNDECYAFVVLTPRPANWHEMRDRLR